MDVEGRLANLQTQMTKVTATESNIELLEQINTNIDKALFAAEPSLPNYPEYCWTTEIDSATKCFQYWAAERLFHNNRMVGLGVLQQLKDRIPPEIDVYKSNIT
eukprot:3737375-Ditylum_brightwellii.AAC.1